LLGPVLQFFGVPKVNYADLGFDDYALIGLHILVTAAIIYFVFAGLNLLTVRLVHAIRRSGAD
jgi:hypothetical protein